MCKNGLERRIEMSEKYGVDVRRLDFAPAVLAAAFVLIVSTSATAATDAEAVDSATSLLAISFVLCVCILAVSGFSLWQSHKYYIDTVRLSRETTVTTAELHQKVVDMIFDLKGFLVHESKAAAAPARRRTKAKSVDTAERVGKIAASIDDTESKIKELEETLDKLNEQLNFTFHPAGLPQKIAALNDIEFAVLFKLSQDPRFFERQSFSSFGATPKVLDSLLSSQLIVFDMDGKAGVPQEVATALRHSTPDN